MPDCTTCRENRQVAPVPYIVHEATMARLERTIKRLWILLIVMLILFVGTNAGWIIYESQFEIVETTSTEIAQDSQSGGRNLIIGGDIYGEADGQDNTYEIPYP